jgi:hypothetical protein
MTQHRSVRLIAPLAVFAGIAAVPTATHAFGNPQYMRNYILVGGTYFAEIAGARSADECRKVCAPEPRCRAWTYSRKSSEIFHTREERCFLYSTAGRPSYARGSESGIKPAPPAVGGQRPDPPVVRRN